jgi:hypothetical protein
MLTTRRLLIVLCFFLAATAGGCNEREPFMPSAAHQHRAGAEPVTSGVVSGDNVDVPPPSTVDTTGAVERGGGFFGSGH